MCGRYYIDEETANELQKIVKELDQKFAKGRLKKDIRPTDFAPILTWEDEKFCLKEARWGFQSAYQKGPIFNARIESVDSKPMFKERLLQGRCLVPASGFYEWSKDKQKHQFFCADRPLMLMGGLYRMENQQVHFTILTKAACGSIAQIHDRMPVILKEADWLKEAIDISNLKNQEVLLEKYIENEQLKFDFS